MENVAKRRPAESGCIVDSINDSFDYNDSSVSSSLQFPFPVHEYGSCATALFLTIFSPLFMICLHLLFMQSTISNPTNFQIDSKLWFDPLSFLVVLLFVFVEVILGALSVGKIAYGQPCNQGVNIYRLNGWCSASIKAVVLILLMCYCDAPITYIHHNFFQMMTSAITVSVVISVLLYVKSLSAAPSSISPAACFVRDSCIHGFFWGRELNPRLGSVDLKLALYRVQWHGLALVNAMLVSYGLFRSNNYNSIIVWLSETPTTWVCAGLLQFVSLSHIINESNFLTSLDCMDEGLGFFTVSTSLTKPFLPTLLTKFVIDHGIEQHWLWLVISCGLFMVGFLIDRCSNSQKHEFRTRPQSSAVSHLRTLATSHGNKLLISSWWGLVRHPNYLGHIIMAWSLPLSVGWNLIYYILPAMATSFLVQRAERDNIRCQRKYGKSWEKYCERVPKRIVPKLY